MDKKKSRDMELLDALDSIQIYGGLATYGTDSSNTACTNSNCDCKNEGCIISCSPYPQCTIQVTCSTNTSCGVTDKLCGLVYITDKCAG